jgi:hypothetical protein
MGKLLCKKIVFENQNLCFGHSWSIALLFLQAYGIIYICSNKLLPAHTKSIIADLIMHLLPSYQLFNAHFVVILDDQNIEFPTPYITNAMMKIKKWPVTMRIDNSALDVPQLKKLH